MKRVLPIFLVALSVVFSGTAMAGPWGRGMGQSYGGYGMGPYAYGSANLSPEKATQLQALRESYLKDVSPLQMELFNKRMQMRTLWTSSSPDQTQISALQKDLLVLQGRLQEKRLRFSLEARKLLYP